MPPFHGLSSSPDRGRVATARGAILTRLAPWLLLLPAACNIGKQLDVKDKDFVQPGSLANPTALSSILAGALSQFQVAWSGSADEAGSGHEGQINMTGLFTDEYIDLETFPTRIAVDERIATPTNASLRGTFLDLSQARVSAERAAAQFVALDSTESIGRAEASNLAAFSYVLFAENYCSGIPFSSISATGTISYGAPLPTDSVYARAIAAFDTASAVAAAESAATAAAGALDTQSVLELNLARVGRARVLLDLDQLAAAGVAADSVPDGFTYVLEGSANSPRENNGIWYFASLLSFSVADLEGGNGLPFVSANDPRVPFDDTGAPGFSGVVGTDFIEELKYPSPTSNVVLGDWIEARLIRAEAQLNGAHTGTYITTLNALRATNPGLAPLVAPATFDAQVDQLFSERAFWQYLTAHRLSDLRRLIRQYGRGSETVFPTGTDAVTGAPYGTDVTFPVSSDETNNPNFAACANRNA